MNFSEMEIEKKKQREQKNYNTLGSWNKQKINATTKMNNQETISKYYSPRIIRSQF